jgi:CheY-like chemotaxis protein
MPTKILAIDDSKTMRLAIKITFAAEDADVTSVSKGSEAVARAKQMAADVVLVDAALAAGEPSGYEVCRALKQDPATAGIPVVLLVSGQTGVDQALLTAVGGDDWLAKPFDTQELIDKVAALRGKPAVKPAAAADDEAAASQSGQRLRPQNRTQIGMASPAVAPTPKPAAAAPAAPAAAAKPAVAKPAISPASLAAKPAAAAPPAPASKPVAATPPTPASKPVAATPAVQKPVAAAAAPRSTPAAAGLARPTAPASAMSGAGGPIPIAIPIPFTAADSPTPGMVERLRQAAAAGSVDPKVAEAIASLSREVIEAIVWEVVPELAESILRKHAKSA